MAQTILLALDLDEPESGRRLLTEALKLLAPGGQLHVVSVVPDFGSGQLSQFFKKDFEKEALHGAGQALAGWVRDEVPGDIEVKPHILHGKIYDEILCASDKLDAELIVIGSHRPELRDYLLGPNAARVVRHSPKSVYVVRN